MDFIEVKRIVTNKMGEKVTVPETIAVAEVKTFRPWHKGINDKFKGDATLVVLYNKNKVTGDGSEENDEKNLNTMLINEKYEDLRDRLSGRVIIIAQR